LTKEVEQTSLEISKDARQFILAILRGASFLAIGVVVLSICNLLMKYILFRTWTPEAYGVFTLILTIASILNVATEFNLNSTTTIILAKDVKNTENKKTVASVLVSFLLLTLVYIAVTLALFNVPGLDSPTFRVGRGYFGLLWLYVILLGINAIMYGVVRAYKRMNLEAASKIMSGLVMVGTLAFVLNYVSILSIAQSVEIIAFSQIMGGLFLVYLVNRGTTGSETGGMIQRVLNSSMILKASDLRSVLRFSFYLSSISVPLIVLSSMDRLMVSSLLSTEMLGFYGGALFIVAFPKLVTGSVAASIQPYISEVSSDLTHARRQYSAFLRFFLIVAALGYGALILIANYTLMLLPSSYSWITSVVRILLVGMLLSDVFQLNATFICSLRLAHEIRRMTLILLFVIIADVLLNLVLIPPFGLEGAAAATSLSFLALAITSSVQVHTIDRRHFNHQRI